jgi:hypothetical protein
LTDLCPTCNRPPCPDCNQAGLIIHFDDHQHDRATPCPHVLVLRLKQYLGPEISRVQHVKESILDSRTKDNLLIRLTSWKAVLPHLKLVLGRRGPKFRYQVVTDERILLVYLGNESFKLRMPEDREDRGVTNSLADLMESPDLMIVRVGHIFHKNKAAEGAFLEALSLRRFLDKPTWIIDEDPQRRIETGVIWGQELPAYLNTYGFQQIRLDDEAEDEPGLSLDSGDEAEQASQMLGSQPVIMPAPKPTFRPPAKQEQAYQPVTPVMIDEGAIMGGKKPFKKNYGRSF